jgi:hypothetical protein
MNEIQARITGFLNLKRKSINHCLLVLGAPHDEVYYSSNDRIPKTSHRASNRSIYDNYERHELLAWARYLYVESLKKYHPDIHPENPRLYTEICQELGKAYLRAKRILGCVT